MPRLVGRTLRGARRLLARRGCAQVRLRRAGTRPAGARRIVAQRPAAGTALVAGRTLTVRLEPPAARARRGARG